MAFGLTKRKAALLLFFGAPVVLLLILHYHAGNCMLFSILAIYHVPNYRGIKFSQCHVPLPMNLRLHCLDYISQQLSAVDDGWERDRLVGGGTPKLSSQVSARESC